MELPRRISAIRAYATILNLLPRQRHLLLYNPLKGSYAGHFATEYMARRLRPTGQGVANLKLLDRRI